MANVCVVEKMECVNNSFNTLSRNTDDDDDDDGEWIVALTMSDVIKQPN